MPGGRLTRADRQRIGSGLTDGLGYAEIARQLGRPTSTVSREVARNGGPGGYRADHAQRATGQRARRSARPAAHAHLRPAAVGADGRESAVVRGFAERLAAVMVENGLPRMAARVLARLITTESGSLTAAELVARLRVSPASVSKAVGYLEGLEVIRRERRDPRGRRDTYVIDDDVWLRAWLTSARTHGNWADTAEEGAGIFGAGTAAGARLERMHRFFADLSADMAGGSASLAAEDALTLVAALAHAGTPLAVGPLAVALGWPVDRVHDALRDAERHPEITDPVALRRTASGAYTVTARPGRLTTAQRAALGGDGSLS
ncbi:MarR family transcriptional regulator [Streptomyces sp. NPDC004838]